MKTPKTNNGIHANIHTKYNKGEPSNIGILVWQTIIIVPI